MTGEFISFDAQQDGADDERRVEREQTRAALQNASNELVDMTVQTPWERQRESVEGSLYEGLGLIDSARTRRPQHRSLSDRRYDA